MRQKAFIEAWEAAAWDVLHFHADPQSFKPWAVSLIQIRKNGRFCLCRRKRSGAGNSTTPMSADTKG